MRINEIIPDNDGETRTLIVNASGGKHLLLSVSRTSPSVYAVTLHAPVAGAAASSTAGMQKVRKNPAAAVVP